jgi:hypothetical protein
MPAQDVYTSVDIVECPTCGVIHGIPHGRWEKMGREAEARGHSTSVYCPNGHIWHRLSENKVERAKREVQQVRDQLAAERARHDQTRAELEHTEARRRGEKAAKTKLKRRAAAGACPCCNRQFADLAAHMTNKHPDFVSEALSE